MHSRCHCCLLLIKRKFFHPLQPVHVSLLASCRRFPFARRQDLPKPSVPATRATSSPDTPAASQYIFPVHHFTCVHEPRLAHRVMFPYQVGCVTSPYSFSLLVLTASRPSFPPGATQNRTWKGPIKTTHTELAARHQLPFQPSPQHCPLPFHT